LPSKINVYYATWTRLGLSGVLRKLHHVYGRASIEFDGNRTLGVKAARQVRLFSRNGREFTRRFALIALAFKHSPDTTIIEGEIVAFDDDGVLCPAGMRR